MIRIGRRKFSWNSVLLRIGGVKSDKVTSIDWGQKITDELIYAAKRDGVPVGVTAGKWEPDTLKMKFLSDEWNGSSILRPGFRTVLSLGGTVAVTETDFDILLQFFEENIDEPLVAGTMTIAFPTCRVMSENSAEAEGVAASQMDVGIRVIEPPVTNGVRFASQLRALGLPI